MSGEEFDERKLDAAFSSLEEFKVFAGQRGVEILLENTPNGIASARAAELLPTADASQSELLLRHRTRAHGQGIEHEFEIMKERIRSTHMHDNNGQRRCASVSGRRAPSTGANAMELLGITPGPVSAAARDCGSRRTAEAPDRRSTDERWTKLTKRPMNGELALQCRRFPASRTDAARISRSAKRGRHVGERVEIRRMAIQSAQIRQDRVSDRARRHRPDAMRRGEEQSARSRSSRPEESDPGELAHRHRHRSAPKRGRRAAIELDVRMRESSSASPRSIPIRSRPKSMASIS